MHPFAVDLASLNDRQLEEKLAKLNSVYFLTENESVRHQIILLMDTYKIELEERRLAEKKKKEQDGKDDLDNLIKIN